MRTADPPSENTNTAAGDDPAALRAAMLSVYYESLGRQFEIAGAPSVLLPAQTRTQPLEQSLEVLSQSPTRLLAALWLLVRGVHPDHGDEPSGSNYPAEIRQHVEPGSLPQLVERRRQYRAGANVFAAALVACRDGHWNQFLGLSDLLRSTPDRASLGITEVTQLLMGVSADEFLDSMSREEERHRAQAQIRSLEREVGLNIYGFVEQFADAAAFSEFAKSHVCPTAYSGTGHLVVYPASSVIRQDRRTLTTSATATTLVTGRPVALAIATDPQAWSWASDVIKQAHYVQDPVTLEAKPAPESLGMGFDGVQLLEEDAVFTWGRRSDERSTFSNVLNIEHKVADRGLDQQRISIEFSLCRSIDSTVAWDRRSGGLQLNQGFIKVRPLGQDTWRVTWRKLLRFSDRTPYAGAQGLLDLGQMLNYLAPAALTWWVESEIYSMSDDAYSEDAAPRRGEESQTEEDEQ